MPIRSRMSLIMVQIEPEHLELFALEFGKIAEYDFIYTVSSGMSSIMNLMGPELFELSALEFENLPYLTLFSP